MMAFVRNFLSLATPVIALLVAISAFTAGFLIIDNRLPRLAEAVITASSLTLLAGSYLVSKNPRLYFWRQRVVANLGRHVAPAWRLRITYRSRLSPNDATQMGETLRGRGFTCDFLSDRTAQVIQGGTRVEVHWDEPDLDNGDGPPDWFVFVDADYPTIPYQESIRFLRGSVMPLLETVEQAIEAVAAPLYHLDVIYSPRYNPFEGLLIRAVPGALVSHYSVMLRPEGARDEKIDLSRDRLSLEAGTRSGFERQVERLLTLNGSWPADYLGRSN